MEPVLISIPVQFWKLEKPLKFGKLTITEYRYQSYDYDQDKKNRLAVGARLIDRMVLHTSDNQFFYLKFVSKVVRDVGCPDVKFPVVYTPKRIVPYLKQLIEFVQIHQYDNVFEASGYGFNIDGDDFEKLKICVDNDLNNFSSQSVLSEIEETSSDVLEETAEEVHGENDEENGGESSEESSEETFVKPRGKICEAIHEENGEENCGEIGDNMYSYP